MPQPAVGGKQFFLGIQGEQSGPFPESEILARIKKSLIRADALIWHEGLPDWQPIGSLEPFKTTLSLVEQQFATAAVPVENTQSVFKPGSYKPKASKVSFGENDPFLVSESAAGEPIFKADDESASFLRTRMVGILGGLAALSVVGMGAFFFQAEFLSLLGLGAVRRPAAQQQKPALIDQREVDLRKAQSELLLSPDASLKVITDIAKSSPGDKVGKEALATAVDFYKKMQRPVDAARLYMDTKQPLEAAKLFMAEQPPVYKEAEEAYFAAYKAAPAADPGRRNLLLDDIKLLLGPLGNVALATERIREMERTFPHQPHPFQYYSKSLDEKIADIFSRTSFYFVQNLLAYINAELPQIVLVSRPLIEVKRDRQGVYRIVGTYKGEVRLNQDRLSGIYFVFWLVGDQWVIVDTNLTTERQKFAKLEREKYKTRGLSSETMLDRLEQIFRNQFPNYGLHERVTGERRRSAATVE